MHFRNWRKYKASKLCELFRSLSIFPASTKAVTFLIAYHNGLYQDLSGYPEPQRRGGLELLHPQAGPSGRRGPLPESSRPLHPSQDPGLDPPLPHHSALSLSCHLLPYFAAETLFA